jgi:iron complex outermembrane recepter protein
MSMEGRLAVVSTVAVLGVMGVVGARGDEPAATVAAAAEVGTARQDEGQPARQETPRFKETLVVTASKLPRREDEVTQRVDRIEAAEIGAQLLPSRNLAELLAGQPGAAVSVLSRNDANWGAYGALGPKYNSYLLDGLPVDAFVDTMSLDPWAFEAVERQRGPASVLYTSYLSMDFAGNQSPLAGTTNLILRRRVDQDRTRVELAGGSYKTLSGRFYHQGRGGPLHYFVGGGRESSDYTDYGSEGSWLHMLDTPRYDKTKLYLGATWVASPNHEVSVFAHHASHDGYVGRPNRDYGHGYDTLNADYRGRLGAAVEFRAKVGYRGYDRRWGEDNYNPPASPDLSLREHDGVTQHILPADVSLAWKQKGGSVLTVGADYQHVNYQTYADSNGRSIGNDATGSNTGLYAQEELLLGRFTLRAGARFNRTANEYKAISGALPGEPQASWDKALWSAGARWRAAKRVSFFANAGTGFVAPSAKSVGGTLRSQDEGVAGHNGQLPNPGLKPESGLSADVGAQFHLPLGIDAGLRGFVTGVDDAIVENRVSENPPQSRSLNAGKTKARGVEVEARGRVKGRLGWFANATFARAKVDNPLDADQNGATVPFVPGTTANAGLSLDLPRKARVRADVRYFGAIYDSTSLAGRLRHPSYTVASMAGEWPVVQREGYAVTVKGEVYNLFDERYEMPWQFRDPGRRGTLALSFVF